MQLMQSIPSYKILTKMVFHIFRRDNQKQKVQKAQFRVMKNESTKFQVILFNGIKEILVTKF